MRRRYPLTRKQVATASAQCQFVAAAFADRRASDDTELTLTLAESTPSPNELNGHHWAFLDRIKTRWGGLVLEALSRQRAIGFWPGRRRASLHVMRIGVGVLDADNLVASTKILIDQLRHRGLIVNDDAAWLSELKCEQRKCRKGEKPSTVVTITWEVV